MRKSSSKRWGFKTFPAEMGLTAGLVLRSKIKKELPVGLCVQYTLLPSTGVFS